MSKLCGHNHFHDWHHFVYTTLLLTPYSLLLIAYKIIGLLRPLCTSYHLALPSLFLLFSRVDIQKSRTPLLQNRVFSAFRRQRLPSRLIQ
jgi:hypothetical protein